MPYKYLLLLLLLLPQRTFSQMTRKMPATPVLYDPLPIHVKKDSATGLIKITLSQRDRLEQLLERYRLLYDQEKGSPCATMAVVLDLQGLSMLTLKHPEASDLRYARRQFREAASYGCGDALAYLSYMYREGLGVSKDTLKAQSYFAKALAKRVSGTVWYNLAYFYEIGVAGHADTAMAMSCYRLAAQNNHAAAEFKIGLYYLYGFSVQQDGDIAVQWLERAAARGIEEAYFEIANIYLNAIGVPRDYSKAFENFVLAADLNIDEAMYWVGWLYEHGKGVARNDTTAASWYKKASEQGNAAGRGSMGVMLYEGRGVEKDTVSGRRMIEEAAEAGVPFYQTYLGIIEGKK